MQTRASGILLHPTSLPGRFGIGDLGSEAYRFADFLVDAGQRLWQVLPLGPTGTVYDNSPYQCFSVFAGNPLLISLEKLAEDKFLEASALENAPCFTEHCLDYEAVTKYKLPLLQKSFQIFDSNASSAERGDFQDFCCQNSFWLDDYSLFMALREAHGPASWNTWEEDIKWRQPDALDRWRNKLDNEVRCHKYQQFQFFRQWSALKEYCNGRGIRLIGDIPIFVALDSAEVWSRPNLFCLDSSGKPTVVAGVPPDYFSETGQLWGNPLYRWDVMAKDGYAWWIERFRITRRLVDIIRLDHFRGFEKYWEVTATETTAVNGRWVPGPGAALFEAVQKKLGQLPIIAEDLGMITPEVEALRDQLGFPGMRVLHYAFGDSSGVNVHMPPNYPNHCVVYTGTHDNNTTVGWFRDDDSETTTMSRAEREKERQCALEYLGTTGHEINWDLIRMALMSAADTAIIPLQDILGLGSEARMNTPGKTGGNWHWRFTSDMLTNEIKVRLRELTRLYGR
jgi:4-alpha-glucanotransferase